MLFDSAFGIKGKRSKTEIDGHGFGHEFGHEFRLGDACPEDSALNLSKSKLE